MKNSDQPIYPSLMQQVGEDSFRASKPNDPKEWNFPVSGLTKREYFAGLAMQATMTSTHLMEAAIKCVKNTDIDINIAIAMNAVEMADHLLKQLER